MFITALFTIARMWKQPRCPSADEWISKLWYVYTMGYYSAVKKNSFESVLMKWMKLEPIIQSEVSQKDKDYYSILMLINFILNVHVRYSGSETCFSLCVSVYVLVVSDSLWPYRLQPARLLSPWNSPGKITGVGSHSLF